MANALRVDRLHMGTAADSSRGVSFTLSTDATKVAFTKVAASDTALLHNNLYSLGTGVQLLKVAEVNGVMKAGVLQKGQGNPSPTRAPCADWRWISRPEPPRRRGP